MIWSARSPEMKLIEQNMGHDGIRLDTGECQSQIAAALHLAASTIRTVLKNKEKVLSSATATTTSSATGITRSRNNTEEEMKKPPTFCMN
ncbi:hypothetical protein TNCV_2471111 [Trichonephila clavipes]|nr:hypothetical protein TNCV_2471111 [Trichonephila clavipes]